MRPEPAADCGYTVDPRLFAGIAKSAVFTPEQEARIAEMIADYAQKALCLSASMTRADEKIFQRAHVSGGR